MATEAKTADNRLYYRLCLVFRVRLRLWGVWVMEFRGWLWVCAWVCGVSKVFVFVVCSYYVVSRLWWFCVPYGAVLCSFRATHSPAPLSVELETSLPNPADPRSAARHHSATAPTVASRHTTDQTGASTRHTPSATAHKHARLHRDRTRAHPGRAAPEIPHEVDRPQAARDSAHALQPHCIL